MKASEIPDTTQILNQIAELAERNKSLEQELRVVETGRIDKIGDYTYEELRAMLENTIIDVPEEFTGTGKPEKTNLLQVFLASQKEISVGLTNRYGPIVEYKGKWYLFYHDALASGKTHLRNVNVTELKFNEDGSIQPVTAYK